MVSVMYAYQMENPDRRVFNEPGRYVAGAPIGIILFGKAGYALPPGSVENATTFNFPVLYKAIPAADIPNVVRPEPHPEVLEQLIGAGQELVEQGCRAIVAACGYFGNYLPEARAVIKAPCFFSSLMQLPLILNSIGDDKKVGVICADGRVLPKARVISNCGVSDKSRLVIRGGYCGVDEAHEIVDESWGYNPKKLEQDIVACARQMVEEDPLISAFLLECTLFPACSYAVSDALKMPVYDFVTLINWVYSAVVHRPYYGYI